MGSAVRSLARLLGIVLLAGSIVVPDLSHARMLGLAAVGAALVAFAPGDRRQVARRGRRRVIRMGALFMTVYLVAGARLLRMTVTHPDETSERLGVDAASGDVLSNPRLREAELSGRRGRILSRSGEVLAETRTRGGLPTRIFHEPATYPLVGYHSPLKFGLAGLERALDPALSGRAAEGLVDMLGEALFGRLSDPADVVLTIDLSLQQLAMDLLSGWMGSAVLMEANTGRILVMASTPTYDPNALTAVSNRTAESAQQAWGQLLADEQRPLLLRATTGLYPPGSTFKIVTAAAALEAGIAELSTVYEDDGDLEVDGRTIVEPNRPDPTRDRWTLEEGLAFSLNVVYAQVGLELGAGELANRAGAFGVGQVIPFALPVSGGQVASSTEFLDQPTALADTAFGQGELLVTPLHMALVCAAVAAGGTVPTPTIVDRIVTEDGEIVTAFQPWRTAISPETAAKVRAMMETSAEIGYASGAQIPGVRVGAKTGTAESGQEAPHSWFIAYAGEGEERLAVSVCVEYGGDGSGIALSIGRALLARALDVS